MKKIPLTQGKFAIVDNCDYAWASQFKWCFDGRYAQRRQGKAIRLHVEVFRRFFTGPYKAIDHINGDRLDNRRENLRSATPRQNARNMHTTGGSSSKFKGVCWDRFTSNWKAYIKLPSGMKHLGRFEDEEEAARSYNKAAQKYFGEFAYLNQV